jgi:hypothetical protein
VFAVRGNPQTSPPIVYRVPRDGDTATLLLANGDSPDLRPRGSGKQRSRLRLRYRWVGAVGAKAIRLTGTLEVGGHPAAGERILLGRLGQRLPTRRVAAAVTGSSGGFTSTLRVTKSQRRLWRVATAFFAGSKQAWAMTAFASIRRG